MDDAVKNFFKKYAIRKSEPIIVACSGGSDSMALASAMLKFFEGGNVTIAHFNHR